MTAAATLTPTLGHQPIGNFSTAVEVAQSATGYVPLIPLGTIMTPIDPYWGGGEVIRLRVPANTTAIPTGGAAVWNTGFTYAILPNTTLLGQSVAIAVNAVPLNAGFDQYAWFYIGGTVPCFSNATVAANVATGIAAAGQLGANAAGKQILNARVVVPATTTVAKANTAVQSGSNLLRVANSDGWFVGVYLSGTGIPAATTVTAIDSSGTLVTMNNNATITSSATVTATYNNATIFWNVVQLNRPMAQGPIT
jgi:hypothetical protein